MTYSSYPGGSPASNPYAGLSENLMPNPPASMPEAPTFQSTTAHASSPFLQPMDADTIIAQLVLDRPLKLFIPDMHKFPEYEFRIINNTPQELAAAHNFGFRQVDQPEYRALFDNLVSGSDADGKPYKPLLMARPKKVGRIIAERKREKLAAEYAGLDPKYKDLSGKYTKNVVDPNETYFDRSGANWRIKIR